jgi:hypothetical protein
LPSFVFVRRLDEGRAIGIALAMAARGYGMRAIARRLAVPRSTIRGWWQRVRTRAPQLLAELLALATSLDPAPVDLTASGAPGVLQALQVAWQRARQRRGERVPDRWGFWSLISGGLALAKGRTPPFSGGAGPGKVGASP